MSTLPCVQNLEAKQKSLAQQKANFTLKGSPPSDAVLDVGSVTHVSHTTGKPGAPPVEPDQGTPPNPDPGDTVLKDSRQVS